jgi:iron-sulfur cluster assembly accessory protein
MINVSTLATEKLKEIIKEQGEEGSSLRVVLMPGENGGAQYMLALEKAAKSDDTVIQADGVSILLDSETAPLMEGAEIDYRDDLMSAGFVINNPNIQMGGGGGCACGGQCGCGGH